MNDQFDNDYYRNVQARLNNTSTSSLQSNDQGIIGDTVDMLQHGAYKGVAGIGETFGLDSVRDWGSQGAQEQIESLSVEGRKSLGKEFVSRADDGSLTLGDGAKDWRTWLLTTADMVGMNADLVIGGGLVKGGTLALTKVAGFARNKALQRGASKEVANELAIKASESYARKHGKMTGDVLSYGGAAHAQYGGMQAIDMREEVLAMDWPELIEVEPFRKRVLTLKAQNPNASDLELAEAAKTDIANMAANETLSSPELIASNVLLGGLGGKALESLLKGGKQALGKIAIEGVTEGSQGAIEQRTQNRVGQEFIDENIELNQDIDKAFFNEAIAGAGAGAAFSGVGKVVDKVRKTTPLASGQAFEQDNLPEAELIQAPVNENGDFVQDKDTSDLQWTAYNKRYRPEEQVNQETGEVNLALSPFVLTKDGNQFSSKIAATTAASKLGISEQYDVVESDNGQAYLQLKPEFENNTLKAIDDAQGNYQQHGSELIDRLLKEKAKREQSGEFFNPKDFGRLLKTIAEGGDKNTVKQLSHSVLVDPVKAHMAKSYADKVKQRQALQAQAEHSVRVQEGNARVEEAWQQNIENEQAINTLPEPTLANNDAETDVVAENDVEVEDLTNVAVSEVDNQADIQIENVANEVNGANEQEAISQVETEQSAEDLQISDSENSSSQLFEHLPKFEPSHTNENGRPLMAVNDLGPTKYVDEFGEHYGAGEVVTPINLEADSEPVVTLDNKVDRKAHEAATSPLNELPEPSDKQKQVNNYRLGRSEHSGFKVGVENPQGSVRKGVDADGTPWQRTMQHHYGDITGTKGADGDAVDVFIKPGTDDGDLVFVVDQINPHSADFDEHKVMLGFDSIEEAEQAYLANYDDGWQGLGAISAISKDAFKLWLKSDKTNKPFTDKSLRKPKANRKKNAKTNEAEKPTGEKSSTETVDKAVDKTANAKVDNTLANDAVNKENIEQPIEDYGEKIGGARKDVWQGFSEQVAADVDVKTVPLSQSFPQPDYEKLAAQGVDKENLALIALIRATISNKPRRKSTLERWSVEVDVIRKDIAKFLAGKLTIDELVKQMALIDHHHQELPLMLPVMADLPLSQYKDAAKYKIGWGRYGMFKGETYNPPKVFYHVLNGKTTLYSMASDDLGEVQARLKSELQHQAHLPSKKFSKVSVYIDRATKTPYLGWKSSAGVLRIKDFDDPKSARAFLNENPEQVEALLTKLKATPSMRKAENAARVGPARSTNNITSAEFADTFGFRGIEFGNWVEQGKRQQDLNQAYDALMDLAEVLELPPKALSLHGELGLAFGARGRGGKTAAAAHYEPGKVVINLTKKTGAGSLAHEWFHALDNYFGKYKKKGSDFVTEHPYAIGRVIRPKVADAFAELLTAISRSNIPTRALALDKRRSSAYWSQMVEMTARSFERYVIDKLKGREWSNEYLANIVSDKGWNDVDAQGNSTYPYPTDAEAAKINPAFDSLFKAIEHKPTDKGVELYNVNDTLPDDFKGATVSQVENVLDRFLKRYKGLDSLNGVKVYESPEQYHSAEELASEPRLKRRSGAYNVRDNTLLLFAKNLPANYIEETLRHELFVHKGLGVFDKETQAKLLKRLSETRLSKNELLQEIWQHVDRNYGHEPEAIKAEEFFANLAGMVRKHGHHKTLYNQLKRLFAQIGRAIWDWAHDVGLVKSKRIPSQNELVELVYSMADAFEAGHIPNNRAWVVEARNKDANLLSNIPMARASQNALKLLGEQSPSFNLNAITKALGNKLSDMRKHWLGLLPRRYLADLAGKKLPSMARYMGLAQQLDADRTELINDSAAVVDKWRELNGKYPDKARELADLMHESTQLGVDPSKEYQPLTDDKVWDHNSKSFVDAVNPGAVIDAQYVKEKIKVINEQARGRSGEATNKFMQRISELKKRLAFEQNRKKDYPSVREKFLALPNEMQQLFSEVSGHYEKQRDDEREALLARIESLQVNKKQKAALRDQIRAHFENNKVEFYFPLQRFGDYWVRITDGAEEDPETLVFEMFESQAEQQKFLAEQQGKYDDNQVFAGKKFDNMKALDGVSSGFLTDVVASLSELGSIGQEVADQVYQMYLQRLPDLSARKHKIHRKGVKGFHEDALRAFAHNSFHSAYQISKLRHSEEMLNTLEVMKTEAEKLDSTERNQATDLVNEMFKRHDWVMNPQGSAWSNQLTSLGFAWYLGITPAAAMTNLMQTPMVALPVIGSRYGYGKTAKALLEYSKMFVKGGHVDKHLVGDDLKAFEAFKATGVIDKTQTYDLAGVGEGGLEYNSTGYKVMKGIGYLFHHAERYNREVTAMAAYKLARSKGVKYEDAVQQAIDLTYEAHFDYSSSNKARFMQNDFAKVALIFRQHSVNMTYRLWRDFHQMFKGETAEVRGQAQRQFAGIMGITALFAGATGLPLYSALGNLLELVMDDEDDPFEFEVEFRNFLADHLGVAGGQLASNGILDYMTGATISSRIGLNNLWLREPNREMEGRDTVQYYAEQVLGAVFGIALSAGTAYDFIRQGQIERGIESALPKAARDILKGVRYSANGVETLNGDNIIEELGHADIFKQMIGYTPFEVSEQYERNSAVKGHEQRLKRRRSVLLNKYALAVRLRDREFIGEVQKDINRFNKINPELAITAQAKERSLTRRRKNSEQAVNGLVLDKRMKNLDTVVRF
ncbi:PLxRFG domain-containing protein [Endozoicomonas sp. G2_1]|uniref:PLxRFG domain-containing protein n=1 Tax=Endozoicomonas sp. G2_1 TaxID=2821091 RepID=UPI001ADBCCC4|nr:PLxRFG domain-containing protein [Endozoicomonas sp. G2_1]MBO9492211.1 PLxRFG domain-containing protein [Endozoicomonas sp. G2_1]